MQSVDTLTDIERERDLSDLAEAPSEEKPLFVNLTTHALVNGVRPVELNWGNGDPSVRGPILCTSHQPGVRNAIGAHSGSYCVYKALAVASGALDPTYKPDLHNTAPAARIGPHPAWSQPRALATIDPFGHVVQEAFPEYLAKGYDVRPTIAVTRAHIDIAEVQQWMREGKLQPDGVILSADGQACITKAAIEPVWYLPEVARRFNTTEANLRTCLFRETQGAYPELITRNDLKVFLPPIGGNTVYIFGDASKLNTKEGDPGYEPYELAVRVHDECNGSDVFGSDICTCRPYLIHAIKVCIETAQRGGVGVIVYYRKEGRALGEVTKYLVYNKRKRQEGGDTASEYFNCTQHVAGIQDVRFQALMPDPLLWLGITKIDKLVSMSDMKYNAIVDAGIEIVERVPIPPELVPADAHVEINAKVFAGYEGGSVYTDVTEEKLKTVVGRPHEPAAAAAGASAEDSPAKKSKKRR